MWTRLNLFVAWILIPQTLVMGWIAAVGRIILELCGIVTEEEGIPGRLVGLVLLVATVFLVQYFRGSLPPQGNPAGKGYAFGFKLVVIANLLATFLFLFPFWFRTLSDPNIVMILSKFAIAFGYIAVAIWAIGFSFLYQSSLPESQKDA